ncbi:uncharacterized protein EAF02_006151 [Botrytis sinoallii]|uniref:uncharacterized protein n=1 Tax=Botrytis sinoallii TaxID=1463999 RepID=UPI0018FFF190|nr:uncharacterized protein EAF02_006151 [Botrytis sinoallii]KAF7882788.1 hypothetical protein EAF02_006151 [Botrytis sinoallii]
MYLPILSLTLLLGLSAAIAVPAPNPDSALEAKDFIPNKVLRQVVPRQGIPLPEPEVDIEPPRDDGLVPFAGGGPVVGKWVKPTFTPGPEDNIPPFSNSVDLKKRDLGHTKSNAFCPYPGTAYCCNPNPGTGGTLCKWNGDGHLSGCELITGGESVCCSTLGCKGMSGLKEPITTV